MRVVLAVAAVIAASFPATAAAADLTPAGPAALTEFHTFPRPSVGNGQVLTAWSVVVAEGGSAGTVRPRVLNRATGAAVTGDPVQLPAEPGTYTFAAPHLAGTLIGLEQATGGHAIITRTECRPESGPNNDPCQNVFVDIAREGQADERINGAQLAISPIYEPDADGDLRGDTTEDRTDLQLSLVPTLGADCRWRVAATVRNAGPLAADRPVLKAAGSPDLALTPLAAGESRTLSLLTDTPSGPFVSLSSEGPDLVPGNNMATFAVTPARPFTVTAAKQQSLRKGIKLSVRGSCNRKARVTATFKVRGRTIKVARTVNVDVTAARTLTLRPTGAKLRSLRRAAKRGKLTAQITVRSPDGGNTVTAKTVVR